MRNFMRTNRDPQGTALRVAAGFRREDGIHYLLLECLSPLYAMPPFFMVRLSGDRLDQRGAEDSRVYYKAYATHAFSDRELEFLGKAQPGAGVLPFFNFSYPNVIKRLGKKFYKLGDDELRPLVGTERFWTVVPAD